MTSRFRFLGTLFALTAVLVLLIGYRMGQRGLWYPELPGDNGVWTMTETPMPDSAVATLGNPRTRGARYINPFNEKVEAHLITTANFESYKEPAMCMADYGYTLTGEKKINLFGSDGSVRALVLRNDADGIRIIMYYWIQSVNGATETHGSIRDNRDVFPRLTGGFNATFNSAQNCIVRVYTQVHPADNQGRQARRNINEVALAIHKRLKEQAGQSGKGA